MKNSLNLKIDEIIAITHQERTKGTAAASVAVNVMLDIHEKKTGSIDLYRPLRQYVAMNYSEREAQNVEEDLERVKELQNKVEKASDTLEVRQDLLQSYYRALCVMGSCFPMSTMR